MGEHGLKILVTGVPGWLGTRLVEILSENGRDVRCLVLNGQDVSVLKKLGVEIFFGDIRDKSSLKDPLKGVETIFHCAGIIHPRRVKDFYQINRDGTRNLLSAAVEVNAKRFIYISSNSPAGTNKDRNKLLTEKDIDNPYKHYGKSKHQAEQLVKRFQAAGKIETVIIRPCWYYGPGQPHRQTRLFKMVKSGTPLLFGDGKNLRSMSYVDNVVQGLLLAESKSIANGQTYWIADKRPYETIEIYQTIADLLGVKINPRFLPGIASNMCELIDDMIQSTGFYSVNFHIAGEIAKDIACSIKKAEKELGYNPKIDLREGMRKSMEWCLENSLL